ncbi:hypothetical protein P9112_003890 [Eukaryota sp. TZLM1-RC]
MNLLECDPDIDPVTTLVDMTPTSITIGTLLLLGTILSTLPQHFRIIKKRSSHGISPFFLFLANVGQFSVALSSVIFGITHLEACSIVGFWKCYPTILAMLNLVGLFVIYFPITVLFLVFFDGKRKEFNLSVTLLITFCTYAASLLFFSFYLFKNYGKCNIYLLEIGSIAGLISTGINILQFVPQIIKTYKLKNGGSFSLAMLLIQAPGAAIMLFFLIISGENFSVWLSYFTSASQQLILLSLLIKYRKNSAHKGDPPLLTSIQ